MAILKYMNSPLGYCDKLLRRRGTRGLLQSHGVVITLVQDIEKRLDPVVAGNWKDERVFAAEEKVAAEDKGLAAINGGQRRFVVANISASKRRRCVGIVKRITRGQGDCYLVFFRPGIVEVNVILARAGGKERAISVLEKRRLQEQSLSSALCISGDFNVVGIHKRLDWIGDVFNLDVRKLGGAQPLLNTLAQGLFPLNGRIVIVPLFSLHSHMTVVLNPRIAFERAVVSEGKLGGSFHLRPLGR